MRIDASSLHPWSDGREAQVLLGEEFGCCGHRHPRWLHKASGSERMAGEVEREETDAKKTRTDNDAPGKAIPGHVFEAILVRLPARSAVACMMLSKQHRQLICSQEFRKLHCRLGAPLPRPHIAYIMTAPVKRPNQEEEVSSFHGFYLARAGLNCNDAPVRSFTIPRKTKRQSEKKYINTCNGILLLASTEGSDEPGGCILWNPAVADSRMVVTVPSPPPSQRMEYLALGLGYGPRTGTYKILLLRRNGRYANDAGRNHLAIYHLDDPEKEPRVFEGEYGVIRQEALYMDGRIYVIDEHHLAILAVDVDSEIVTSIHLPVRWQTVLSRPMEISGRLCIALKGCHESSIWLLSCDNQWEQVCLLWDFPAPQQGIWKVGEMLLIYSEDNVFPVGCVYVYNGKTGERFRAVIHLPEEMLPQSRAFELCWGYNPTLLSPSSIVAKPEKGWRQHSILLGIKRDSLRIIQKDMKQAHEGLHLIVSFMKFLVGIMEALPKGMEGLVGVPLNEGCYPDSVEFEEYVLDDDSDE